MAGLESVYLAVSVMFVVLLGYVIVLTLKQRKLQADLKALKQSMERKNGS